MSRSTERFRLWKRGGLVVLAAAVALSGCPRQRPLGDAPPDPKFGRDIENVPRAEVITYAQSLSYVRTVGHFDRQPLLSGPCTTTTCPYATTASIEPVQGSHLIRPDDLRSGRIIARIVNEGDGRYSHVGLGARDTTWWWVDYRNGRWRSVFIPFTATDTLVRRGTIYHRHPGWQHSLARWVTGSVAEGWGTCKPGGCCESTDLAKASTDVQ